MAAAGSTGSWREADMARLLSGCGTMPKKDDEQISPYLRHRLRSYEEVQRERADGKARLLRRKPPTRGASRNLGDKTNRDEQDDR
jgi:hypothetical protein